MGNYIYNKCLFLKRVQSCFHISPTVGYYILYNNCVSFCQKCSELLPLFFYGGILYTPYNFCLSVKRVQSWFPISSIVGNYIYSMSFSEKSLELLPHFFYSGVLYTIIVCFSVKIVQSCFLFSSIVGYYIQ